MKVLLSWLRDFAPIDAELDEIAGAFSALGTPVEDMERLGEGLDGIVVARVVGLRRHPKAERVQRVMVDTGTEQVEVWCGAFNMAEGDLVPLATLGTVMPNGMTIGRRKILDEYSEGMLCSPTELGLGGDPGGILILPEGLTPGAPLREALGIESDVLFDLEVNANRPDAMSVAGLARDLAAHFKVPFSIPTPEVTEDESAAATDLADVDIVDPDLCGRFVARVVRGVAIAPSPTWLANRLTLLGMRPINNVVDISNYVMLELGQPNHPYDLARLPGGAIRVRRAREGETMETLDGITRTFVADDLLICNGGDEPIGIAGVMGGADTEISDTTTDVLLEMAWFAPMAVAKTARRLGLRTEASARFEKGCDPEVIDLAAARFCELLAVSGARPVRGSVDARGELPDRSPVRVRTARVNRILGTDLSGDTVADLLEPIGFHCERTGDDNEVTIPTYRFDSTTEIDVIEEVGRLYGYARIGQTVPRSPHIGALSPRQRDRRAVRAALVGLGLSEAMPMPFLAPGDLARAELPDEGITIANPLVAEESVLRTSLLPGLLKSLAYNASHRNAGVGLFEVGHVFRRPAVAQDLPDEREMLAVARAGLDASAAVEAWGYVVDALGIPDAAIETTTAPGVHPTRAARVSVDGEVVGIIGEVDPTVLARFGVPERVAWLEVDLGRMLDLPHGERPYRLVSRYPSSDIDLAFEVDESIPAGAVEAQLRSGTGDLLARLELFDVYRGPQVAPGTRSLAYGLRLQAADRTLTDAEVAEVRRAAIDAVEGALPAKLRG